MLTGLRLVTRFRGGLVFKAHRLVYHSTLGIRVMKKKKTGLRLTTDADDGSLVRFDIGSPIPIALRGGANRHFHFP